MSRLPGEVADAVRALVLQTLQAYAVPRDEFEALQAIVHRRLSRLSLLDRSSMALMLPALYALRRDTIVTAAEVLALAAVAPGEPGEALRLAVARFAGHKDPGKACGWLMTRAEGESFGGLRLQRFEPSHKRDPALYRVAGFPRN